MKWLLPILALLVFSSCALLNGNKKKSLHERYTSREKSEYDLNIARSPRYSSAPLTDEDILNFTSPGCTITKLEKYVPFMGRNGNGINLIIEEFCSELGYSSGRFLLPEVMGVDANVTHFKYGLKGDFVAFMYSHKDYNHKFSNVDLGCGSDIWIAVSRDGGATWRKYFTGLYEAYPVYPKANSKIDLIADDNTIHIEVALTREGGMMYGYMVGSNRYVSGSKNGYLVSFDLDALAKDSDGDGLTDILEAAFMTDPHNSDTDGDGISDLHDSNPRGMPKRTAMTHVYEALIDDMFMPKHLRGDWKMTNDWREISSSKKYTPKAVDNKNVSRVATIVTDDPGIMAVQPEYVRVIVMSKEEYAKKREEFRFYETPTVLEISPLFKVDGKSNLYLIDLMTELGGPTLLLQKKGARWRMKDYGGTCVME